LFISKILPSFDYYNLFSIITSLSDLQIDYASDSSDDY